MKNDSVKKNVVRGLALVCAIAFVFSLMAQSAIVWAADSDISAQATDTSNVEDGYDNSEKSREPETGEDQKGEKGDTSQASHAEDESQTHSAETGHDRPEGGQDSSEQQGRESDHREHRGKTDRPAVTESQPQTEAQSEDRHQSAGSESDAVHLTKTLKSVHGTYRIDIEFDARENVPANAQVEALELNASLTKEEKEKKANRNRPIATERFTNQYESDSFDVCHALGVQETDLILKKQFVQLSVKSGSEHIHLKYPAVVRIESDWTSGMESDFVRVAVYDADATAKWTPERKKQLAAQKKDGEKAERLPKKVFNCPIVDNSNTCSDETADICFQTDRIDTIALFCVAGPIKQWTVHDATVALYGPAKVKSEVREKIAGSNIEGIEQGRSIVVRPELKKKRQAPNHSVRYFLGAEYLPDTGRESGRVSFYSAKGGRIVGAELQTDKASGLVPVAQDTEIAFVWDTELRARTLKKGPVSVSGLMTKNAKISVRGASAAKEQQNAHNNSPYAKSEKDVVKASYDIEFNRDMESHKQDDDDTAYTVSITCDDIDAKKNITVWNASSGGQSIEVQDVEVSGDVVSFKTSEPGTYVVVQSERERVLTTGDGHRYKVKVTLADDETAIPDSAELSVTEITSGKKYRKYVKNAAKTVGKSSNCFSFAHVLDICLVDPDTGLEYQPEKPVQVSVKLVSEPLSDNVNVVHFGRKTQKLESSAQGKTVRFKTDGFSIFVIADEFAYTYTFWCPNESADTGETAESGRYHVSDWVNKYQVAKVWTDCGMADTQIVLDGERPVAPQLDDAGFAGWYEGDNSGNDLVMEAEPYSFDGISVTENRSINLFARFASCYTATFHDAPVANAPAWCVRQADRNNPVVRIDDVAARYDGDGDMICYGWSLEPGSDVRIEDASIELSSNIDLYPIFKPVHWLSYYSGAIGSGASYVATEYVFDAPVGRDGKLPVPTWANHTFLGWFTGTMAGGEVDYGAKVAFGEDDSRHQPGELNRSAGHVVVTGNNLTLEDNVTLYAKWADDGQASYAIRVFKEIDGQSGHFEQVEQYELNGVPGTAVTPDETYRHLPWPGYQFSRCEPETALIAEDGGTAFDIYYELDQNYLAGRVHTLTYADSALPRSSMLPKTERVQSGDGVSLSFKPESGRRGYTFDGWYYDANCTVHAVQGALMPDEDLTLYAGWKSVKNLVLIDPNYGTFADGSTEAMWFTVRIDDPVNTIKEYLDVRRDYVESSSGTYYYVKHDYNYYGGNPPADARKNEAYYSLKPSEASEDKTFVYAPGVYTYAGWYEVHDDGSETKFDFSTPVDRPIRLKLHWKKQGSFYLRYETKMGDGPNALVGALAGDQDENGYVDNAQVVLNRSATAPAGYTFVGWRVVGERGGRIHEVGSSFTLNAEYAVREHGRDTVTMEAVYVKAETATLIYNANGGQVTEQDVSRIDAGVVQNGHSPDLNISADGTQITVRGIAGNATFRLSDGKLADGTDYVIKRNGFSLQGWSETRVCPTGKELELGGEYGVSMKGNPTVLYAVWGTPVRFHLNPDTRDPAPSHYNWGGDWSQSGYSDDATTMSGTRNVGTQLQSPDCTPCYTGNANLMFRYWSREPDGEPYDFSAPVTEALDLYAHWDTPITMRARMIDASVQKLTERESTCPGWTSRDVIIGAEVVQSFDDCASAPEGYTLAFVAAGTNPNDISEQDEVKALMYDSTTHCVMAKTADSEKFTRLPDSTDLFFIFYKQATVAIDYKTVAPDGTLSDVQLNLSAEAPRVVSDASNGGGGLGICDVTNVIREPLSLPDDTFTHFAIAVGDEGSSNFSDLKYVSAARTDTNGMAPILLRNTWRGFQFSASPNSAWRECGYTPRLYVIYFKDEPTVVRVSEQTIGTGTDAEMSFAYHVEVIRRTTSVQRQVLENNEWVNRGEPADFEHGVLQTDAGQLPQLKSGESAYVYLDRSQCESGDVLCEETDHAGATVRYIATSGSSTTVNAVITQSENTAFQTYINNSPASAPYQYQYTADRTELEHEVSFTNSRYIEVHVARVDAEQQRLMLDDEHRASSGYRFSVRPGAESQSVLDAVDCDELLIDAPGYTFADVVCDCGSGPIVETVAGNLSDIIAEPELTLVSESEQTSTAYEGHRLIYAYWPMPKILYLKRNESGALDVVEGYDGHDNAVASNGQLTYNLEPIEMNGRPVVQGQYAPAAKNNIRIGQRPNAEWYRMPPILDDVNKTQDDNGAVHVSPLPGYLGYDSLAVGCDVATNSDLPNTDTLRALNQLNDRKEIQICSDSHRVLWRFDDDSDWTPFTSRPVIYAIYKARGYDLTLHKSVPVEVSRGRKYTIVVQSDSITPGNEYAVEGWNEPYLEASQRRTLTLDVQDGSEIKIIGLEQGRYTITELENQNYTLFANATKRDGTTQELTVTNSRIEVDLVEELDVELTNTANGICKIVRSAPVVGLDDGDALSVDASDPDGVAYVFCSLSQATAFIQKFGLSFAKLEMLEDYLMSGADADAVVPARCNVSLTTAGPNGKYHHSGDSAVKITRNVDFVGGPIITNMGELTVANLVIDGNGEKVDAESALIANYGTLTLGANNEGVLLQNAKNLSDANSELAGNGGAVYSPSGEVYINSAKFDKNTARAGGAVWAGGSITLTNAEFSENNALQDGGAIYANGRVIPSEGVDKNILFEDNRAKDGGAIYYCATDTLSIPSGMAFERNVASGNGAGIYVKTGVAELSGARLTGNKATGLGGAVYVESGAVNVTGDSHLNSNSAENGAAVFIKDGSATFASGVVTGNNASAGGAVGFHVDSAGKTSAKLYFSGTAQITGNTMGNSASNVYLNADSDMIINASEFIYNDDEPDKSPRIGIYVAGHETDPIYKNRGMPGSRFGVYTEGTNFKAFEHDRVDGVRVTTESSSKRLVWGKDLKIKAFYLKSYSETSTPGKFAGTWTGGDAVFATDSYYLPAKENPASAIADDLRLHYLGKSAISKTAMFAYAYVDDESDPNIGFDEFVTDVNWNHGDWQFLKRDGSVSEGDSIVVYFSEPAFVSIENNSDRALTLTGMTVDDRTVVNTSSQPGYGYVYSVNGKVQSVLRPVTQNETVNNMSIDIGKSMQLIFPGGVNKKYSVSGGFSGEPKDIPLVQTGVSKNKINRSEFASFTLNRGKTSSIYGGIVEVVFGGRKQVCKIVTRCTGNETWLTDGSVNTAADADGKTAVLFHSIKDAVSFAGAHLNKVAKIEMLTDYQISGSDLVEIDADYHLELTTAVGDTANCHNYSSSQTARATISRNSDHKSSFLKAESGYYDASLDKMSNSLLVTNLVFDGKNFSGKIDGGVVKTKDCNVTIRNVEFINCVAENGGGIFIDFTPTSQFQPESNEGYLTVQDCVFTGCTSTDGSNRKGGGAIWTTAKTLTLERSSFSNCTASDQGGAVFHRIDTMNIPVKTQRVQKLDDEGNPVFDGNGNPVYENVTVLDDNGEPVLAMTPCVYAPYTRTTVTNCTFFNCEAKAAGGLESDAHSISIAGDGESTTFDSCRATVRGGGGFNVYIYDVSDNGTLPETDTRVDVSNCIFRNCTANNTAANAQGGAFRSAAKSTVISGCKFYDNSAFKYGGAISISNRGTGSASVTDCVVAGNVAATGGGIYMNGNANANASLTLSNCTITNNTARAQGGGVFSSAALTLISTKVNGNRVHSTQVNDAGGIYIDGKHLTVGAGAGADYDASDVSDNMAANGAASNTRIADGNTVCVTVNNDLYDVDSTGKQVHTTIGVTNHGEPGVQFGNAGKSNPAGFSDTYHVFTADDGSCWGIVRRSDETGLELIWGGPPICKITDGNGNLLYMDAAGNYPAVFESLDNGSTSAGTDGAFRLLKYSKDELWGQNGKTAKLFKRTGETCIPYRENTYRVALLVGSVTAAKYITTNQNNSSWMNIVLTTESKTKATDDDPYPYRGSPGTPAMLIRGSTVGSNSLLTAKVNMTLERITLDGGNLTTNVNGAMVMAKQGKNYTLTLGPDTTIQNGKTTGSGCAVFVDNSGGGTPSLMVRGAVIQNCSAKEGGAIYTRSSKQVTVSYGSKIQNCTTNTGTANGGAVYVAAGSFAMNGGTIVNCNANGNGGAIYTNGGSTTLSGGKIQGCVSNGNGGGIFQNNGNVTLSLTAVVTGCTAGSGGGAFVAEGKTFKMAGGYIMNNTARAGGHGGGIAVGGATSRLEFSGSPKVTGNTRTDAEDGGICNVELHIESKDVIKANGIESSAKIGVFVPGARNDNDGQADTQPYKSYGGEGDHFGAFAKRSDEKYLHVFVNDRNGLKGGIIEAPAPNTIYWVKIFGLEIRKDVYSLDISGDESFRFKVELTGVADDGSLWNEVDSAGDLEKYGSLYFEHGVATKRVVTSPSGTTALTDLSLKNGELVDAERLPAGLNYTVTELLTDEQSKKYYTEPATRMGYVGENAGSETGDRYTSKAEFANIAPVCKIETGAGGQLLYRKSYYTHNWMENGTPKEVTDTVYQPAVYSSLERAVENISQDLYQMDLSGATTQYDGTEYAVKMLVDTYLQTDAISIPNGYSVTLTKADGQESRYPYRGENDCAQVIRGFDSESMVTVAGNLTLDGVELNGNRNAFTATSDGGLVYVAENASLTVNDGAKLKNSISSGRGGAVFIAPNGTMTMTGGTVDGNAVSEAGAGAGIYVSEHAHLNMSGPVDFGGTGLSATGGIRTDRGNVASYTIGQLMNDADTVYRNGTEIYVRPRQDIYIAGYSGEDGDESADSLVICGDIVADKGSIWVWADELPRYRSLDQFAKVRTDSPLAGSSLETLRNARPDTQTGADAIGKYLYGITRTTDGSRENLYWYGAEGKARVMLVKVGNGNEPLADIVLSVYTDSERTHPATGTVRNRDGSQADSIDLTQLTATGAGGAFFIGVLPYGTYYATESIVHGGSAALKGYTEPDGYFKFDIGSDGVAVSDENGTPQKTRIVRLSH